MATDALVNDGIRRYPRIGLDVSVRVISAEGRASFARGHDISCGGMALYVPLELAMGELVKMSFELPNSRMQFGLCGTVKNRNGFRYGIEFQKLTPEEFKEIERVTAILALVRH